MAKRRRGAGRPAPATRRMARELESVHELLAAKDVAGARDLLLGLAQRPNPDQEVIELLARVAEQLHDWRTYLFAVETWHRRQPDDPDILLALGSAYLATLRPVTGLRLFERFVERWPDHPEAARASRTIADLQPGVTEMLTELGLAGDEGTEIAALHEEVQSLMEQGRTRDARATAQRLLRRRPDFVPVLNNLTLINLMDGTYQQARRNVDDALAVDPDNVHAHANLVRLLVVSGEMEAARSEAARLLEIEQIAGDQWLKVAEALTFVGDDARVLEVFERAKEAKALDLPGGGLLYHLAAVAAMNQGDETAARRHWREALKREPGLSAAADNLADLHRPVGEREAPWAFEFRNWVSHKVMTSLQAELMAAAEAGDAERVARASRRLLRQNPELRALVPVLLERGDPFGRQLAVQLAGLSREPDLLAALRDFAGSRHGPDWLRRQAVELLENAGVLESGQSIEMWIRGEHTTVKPVAIELHEEPQTFEHAPEVEALIAEAFEALQNEDLERAERRLRRALAAEPEAPDVRQALGQIYSIMGRFDEAESLLRELVTDQPDFIMAAVSLAQLLIQRRQFDEAHALLDPLQQRQSFFVDDYSAFAGVMTELFLAEQNWDAARNWLGVLENVDPEHPAIEYLAEKIARR